MQFASDGRYLACAGNNAITLVETEGNGGPIQIKQRAAAVAAFAGQLWTLDEHRTHLHRFRVDGGALGTPHELSIAPCSQWMVATTGTPAVLMQGAGRRLVVANSDEVTEKEVPAAGVVFPLQGRRHVFCSANRRVLLGAASFPLAAGIEALGGAAVREGRLVVLVVSDNRGRRGVLVVDSDTARVRQQVELVHDEAGEMRIAAQRGMLIVHTSERRFAIVDVLSGTLNDIVESPIEIDDFAVDPVANRIAIRSGDGVGVYTLGRLSPVARPELEIALDGLVLPSQLPRDVAPATPLAASSAPAPQSFAPERVALAVGAPPPQPPPMLAGPPSAKPPALSTDESVSAGVLNLVSVRDAVSIARASNASDPPSPGNATSTTGNHTSEMAPHLDARERLAQPVQTGSPDARAASPEAPVVELYKFRGGSASGNRSTATRHEAARVSRAILEARVDRVYHRALSAHASLDDKLADSASEMSSKQADAEIEQRGPMGYLARLLDLDAVKCDLVWSIVACSYDPRIAPHLESVVGPSARRGLSVSAYGDLVGLDTSRGLELTRWLDAPTNRLVATGLIRASEPASPAERAYVASSRLVSYLAGEDAPEAPVRLVRADRPLLYDDQQSAAIEQIAAALGRSPDPLIVVEGPVGSGRATACARAARRDLLVLDLRRIGIHGLADAVIALRREALLYPGIPVLANIDHLLGEEQREQRKLLGELIDDVKGPLVVTVTVPGTDLGSERPVVRIAWDVPSSGVRAQLWEAATFAIGASPAGDLSTLAYRYRVGPAAIERAVASVRLLRAPGTPLDETALAEGLRHNIAERLGALAKRIEVTQTWEDLVVADDVSDRIGEIIGRIRHAHQVLETWGYRKRMALGAGAAVLLSGPPGTGKTMVAGLIARELELELYQVDLSRVVSKWIGESEKNLARVFDAAEEGHALLLFDEADSLFGQRSSEMKSATDRYANLEVNYLLQRVEAFGGITILTTNLETAIDDALKRRLVAHVRFEPPDDEQRAQLWQRQCVTGQSPVGRDVDYHQLARAFPNMTGANIRNAAISAAFIAAADRAPCISQEHLLRAARAEYHSMGHVLSELRSSKPGSIL